MNSLMGTMFEASPVSLTMLHLAGGDLPSGIVEVTNLFMQVSPAMHIEICLDGRYRERPVSPGEFCIAPPGPVPAARWRGDRSIMIARIDPNMLACVAASHGTGRFELQRRHMVRDPRISHLLYALHAGLSSLAPADRPYVDAICNALALRLLQEYAVSPAPSRFRGGLPRASLKRVFEYVDAHLDANLPLENLAEVSGLSVGHFSRAFRESAGEPPHRYILRLRLARARRLLARTDRPIADIAQTSGFSDQSHLTNLFRRHFGTTPAKMRMSETGVRPEKMTFAATPPIVNVGVNVVVERGLAKAAAPVAGALATGPSPTT